MICESRSLFEPGVASHPLTTAKSEAFTVRLVKQSISGTDADIRFLT